MRTMRLSCSVLAAAVLAAACGEGHAIFNVDVYSFMAGSGGDTLHYTVPTTLGGTVSNPPLAVTLLPGLGSSAVDTVQLTGTAAAQNKSGTGQISFKLYFGADSNTVYSTTPILSTPTAIVGPGVDTVDIPLNGTFTSAQDSLFTQKKVYVGISLQLQNTGAGTLDGRLQLTALHLRLVVNEKIIH